MAPFSSTVLAAARPARLCWYKIILSIKLTWSSVFAKFTFFKLFPQIKNFFVRQTHNLTPLTKKKKLKSNKSWTKGGKNYLFCLTFKLQKLCAYLYFPPVMWEWWRWIFPSMMLFTIPKNIFVSIFRIKYCVDENFIIFKYTNVIICLNFSCKYSL